MVRKVVVFATVGTSIKDNFEKYLVNKGIKYNPEGIWNWIKCPTGHYNRFVGEYIENLNEDGLKSFDLPFPSAEIQSLWLFFEKQNEFEAKEWEIEKIVLFHTKTQEDKWETGKICADAVKKIIDEAKEIYKKGINEDTKVATEEFNLTSVDDIEEFKVGLIDLFMKCNKQIVDARKESKIIVLNITGGYKAIIPFIALFGFLQKDIVTIYGFEEAKDTILIPSLPLNWDYKTMDEFGAIFRGLKMRGNIDSKTYGVLHPRIQVFFDKVGDQYRSNAFGALVSEIYEKERSQRFGYGAPLLEKFKDKDLREKLETKLKEWEYLWIGDQIPETVEHTKNHSLRLLELAYYFLEFTEISITDESLFLLISAIWLHDIGHSGLRYTLYPENAHHYELNVAEFPSLVREWHNLLSYERIKNNNLLDDTDTSEIVALICKYHRNKMPLHRTNHGTKEWQDKIFSDISVKPFEQVLNNKKFFIYNSEVTNNKEILLIASILRFIDACDVQADRVVTPEYKKLREERTKEEINYNIALLEKRKKLWTRLKNGDKPKIEELYGNVQEFLDKYSNHIADFSQRLMMDEEYKKIREKIISQLKETIESTSKDEEKKEIIMQSLGFFDRILFKKIQEAHFIKHSGIKTIYFKKDEKARDEKALGVYFIPDDSAVPDDILEVAKDIYEIEYKGGNDLSRSTEKSFSEKGIIITGVFNGITGKKIHPIKENMGG